MASTTEAPSEPPCFVHVAAHHSTVELNALVEDVLLEPVVRHSEAEFLHQYVSDHRRVEQAPREQRLRQIHAEHGRPILTGHLVLGGALEEHRKAAATIDELRRLVPTDKLGGPLELWIAKFERESRKVAAEQIAAALGLCLRRSGRRLLLAARIACRLRLGNGRI
jgi:hypothetical protein